MKTKRKLNLSLDSKVGKYVLARKRGLNKTQSQIVAGYSTPTLSSRIEQTETYKALEKIYFKDEVLKQITLKEIAEEQVKVIRQDKDLSSKNVAIKNTLERIEPETATHNDEDDRLVVVLRAPSST